MEQRAAKTIGVELVVTAPPVFMRRLKVVVCSVATLVLPRVANMMFWIRNVFPDEGVNDTAVDVAEVPLDFVRVMAFSMVVAPAAAAVREKSARTRGTGSGRRAGGVSSSCLRIRG